MAMEYHVKMIHDKFLLKIMVAIKFYFNFLLTVARKILALTKHNKSFRLILNANVNDKKVFEPWW